MNTDRKSGKKRLRLLETEPFSESLREARGVLVFVSGEEAKEVAVDEGTKGLGAVAVVAQAGGGKDGRLREAFAVLKAGKRGEGDAVSAVELAKGVKELGFEMGIAGLGVGAAAQRFGLRRGIGAYSFVSSHIACLRRWCG